LENRKGNIKEKQQPTINNKIANPKVKRV